MVQARELLGGELNRIFPDMSETSGSRRLRAEKLGEDYPVRSPVTRIVAL